MTIFDPVTLAVDAGPVVVATAADREYDAQVAFDGSSYLVGYSSRYASDSPIEPGRAGYYRRLSPDGRWLDDEPIAIEFATDARFAGLEGVVAYEGGGFLLMWTEEQVDSPFERTQWARRLSGDGSWEWPRPLPFDSGQALCAADACVVLRDLGRSFVAIDGDGAPLGDEVAIPGLRSSLSRSIRLIRDDDYFVVSHLYPNREEGDADVIVHTIGATGADFGTLTETEHSIALPEGVFYDDPQWVEFGGQLYYIALRTAGFDEPRWIEGRTYSIAAGFGEAVALTAETDRYLEPRAYVADGPELQLFFNELLESDQQLSRAIYRSDIGPSETITPYLSAGFFGSMDFAPRGAYGLFVYSRLDRTVGFGSSRVRLHFLGDRSWLLETGAACEDGGQCSSGRCVETRCH